MFKFKSKRKMRFGSIDTLHGKIKTPCFFPDATYGAVKTLTFDEVRRCGIEQILGTTLHLYFNPGTKLIKKLGGLHKFINWSGPILTDSGGWQVFSLIHQTEKGKVDGNGAEFILESKKQLLSPELSINIQADIGSDIILVLDDPILGHKTKSENLDAVKLTINWAKKAKIEFLKRFNLTSERFSKTDGTTRPLLFSIIQGGNYLDLREYCAKELIKIGFDGFGFGGILLKEDVSKKQKLLKQFASLVPEDKIRYGMGVGNLEDIEFCIKNGFDFFDSVVPTRNARHGTCYTSVGHISLTKSIFRTDLNPIDKKCDCKSCKNNITKAYINHLFKVKEIAAMKVCTIHNLYYYNKFIKSFAGKE